MSQQCQVPPQGWHCTREAGHDGPCAAWPIVRVGIVGSRDYPDLQQVREYVGTLSPGTVVVSGGARGVDKTAEAEAQWRGLETAIYPADWNRYGKRAGFLRNTTIVEKSDRIVAFWDGHSRGAMDTVEKARKAGKPVEVITPEHE